MELKRLTLSLMTAGVLSNFAAQATSYVEIDPFAAAQVAANAGYQAGVESEHNAALKKEAKSQDSIAKKATAIATIQTLYKKSMKNAKEFKKESSYYKTIFDVSTNILSTSAEIVKEAKRRPGLNAGFIILYVGKLEMKTVAVANNFASLVSGLKDAMLPGKGVATNDGENLMTRDKREKLARELIYDLFGIQGKLNSLLLYLKYGSLTSLWMEVDPESWSRIIGAMGILDYNKRRWKETCGN